MALNDNVIGCGKDFSLLELLAAAIGEDSSGKPTLRVIDSNAVSGSKFFDCSTAADPVSLEAAFKNLFAFDSNGEIALRISIP
jgi:hypothetical protein